MSSSTPNEGIDQTQKSYEALSSARLTATLVALALSLLYVGPLLLYSANQTDFADFSASRYLLSLAPVAAKGFIVIVVCVGMSRLIRSQAIRITIDAGLLFIAVAVIIYGCYLPLSLGKLDGVDGIEINGLNLAIGLTAGGIAIALRRLASVLLTLILVGPVSTATVALMQPSEQTQSAFLPFSKTQNNVLLISLDNLQSRYMLNNLSSSPEGFDGFTFYSEVTAVGPYSALSTLTTKMGQLPELPEGRKASVFFRDEFISSKLHQSGYDIETYGDFGQSERPSTLKHDYFSHVNNKPVSSYANLLEMSLLRIIPAPDLVSMGFYLLWPALSWQFGIAPEDGVDGNIATLTENDRHPLAHYKLDIMQFRSFVESIRATETGPTARLHHYLFTHEPVRFSETCEYVYGTGYRYVTAIPAETECAVSEIKALVAKLKSEGIYDNTMIIFASDHGPECPLNFTFDPGSHRVSSRWCLSRYQPFLMVKPFEATKSLQFNTAQVSLLDIAQTICSATLPSKACSAYTGANLLDDPEQRAQAPRFILVSKTQEDQRSYNNFEKVEVPRDTSIVEYFGLEKEYSRRVFPARVLPSRTGELTEEGRRASSGDRRGFVTHGPYAHLWPGRYSISVQYQLLDAAESSSYWEVTSERGAMTLYKTSFEPTASEAETSSVEFTLEESAANVELRAFYGGEGALTVRSVVLEKL